MKYIKKFNETFSRKQDNINNLLDKISSKGIESLTNYEIKLLNNGGLQDEFDEEYLILSKRIIDNLNNGLFIKVDINNIPTFFDILEQNGIKIPLNIEWKEWGDKFYFILTPNGLKYDNKQPNHDTFLPTFPDKK